MSTVAPFSFGIRPCLRPPDSLIHCNRLMDALAKSGRMGDAQRLFDEMPLRDNVSWNTLISAYARAGLFPDALRVFHSCPQLYSSSIPWSSLISGFTRNGRSTDALLLFRRMLASGLPPDPYSLGGCVRACSILPSFTFGRAAHALAIKSSLDTDSFLSASLVCMYSKCGKPDIAAAVFASFATDHRPNPVLWTAAVTARTQHGDHLSAMDCFRLMRLEGLLPNQFTLPSVISACASELAVRFGQQIHALAVQTGLDANKFVRSSLVGLYAKCSDLLSAKMVLSTSENDDPVSWNSIIVICSRAALHEDALSLFIQMRRRDINMDEYTFPSALNSVAAAGNVGDGSSIHCLVVKSGFMNHQHVGNALVDMYAKCGCSELAVIVFDELLHQDVVGWTALYNGYAEHVSDESALRVYCRMRVTGIYPDEFVLSGVLSSCGGLALLEPGQQVHSLAARLGLDSFRSVCNALVSMYTKGGCADEARAVFNSMSSRDAITWTAMIVGYAQNGRGRDSIPLFDSMLGAGVRPDYVTFIGLLLACSHAGLVELGRTHFDSMESIYGVAPGPEHYACMADMLGRAGQLSDAIALLAHAGELADTTVWKALLAACRIHSNIDAAERVAGEILQLDPDDPAAYVILSNVYSGAGRWADVAQVRRMMKARGVTKEPGCSWAEEGGRLHVFHVDDRVHPQAAEIHAKLGEMLHRAKAAGYVPDTRWALQDSSEEEKKLSLAHHSEKLAVAFGLLRGGPTAKPIRVFKNLRICGDCHSAIKLVAEAYCREIVLRDANRFHHFSAGTCSCSDYW